MTYRYTAAPLAPSLVSMNTLLLLFKIPRIKTATIELCTAIGAAECPSFNPSIPLDY